MNKSTIRCRRIHKIKIWPNFFGDVIYGDKGFEVRKDDREYKVGDVLFLMEYDPDHTCFTGRKAKAMIVYKLEPGVIPGIAEGYCVLGFFLIPDSVEVKELKCDCGEELLVKCVGCSLDEYRKETDKSEKHV